MSRDKMIKWLDQLESALVRAESARKDIDIILVMRVIRDFLEGELKNGREGSDY